MKNKILILLLIFAASSLIITAQTQQPVDPVNWRELIPFLGDIEEWNAEDDAEGQSISMGEYKVSQAERQYISGDKKLNIKYRMVTVVDTQPEDQIPKGFNLSQNHPNPFNPETTIEYQLPSPCHVELRIYNPIGQRIRTLFDGQQNAGVYKLIWDGKDNSGKKVGSGIYIYRIIANEFTEIKKMVLVQ